MNIVYRKAHMVNLEALTSYKIINSGVDEKPEIKCKCLKRLVGANGFEPSTSWSRTRRASQAALRPDRQAELSASHFASRLAQLSTHSYTRLVPCLGRGVLFAQSLRFAG